MPPRPSPSRIAAALDYLQRLKSGVGEFVGGVGTNLADRARSVGGLAYEALTTDPNIGRMTTAEFSQAAADRAPTPRLDQAARDIGTIGRAIATQPVETGKAIVGGEIDRFKGAFSSPQTAGEYAGSFLDPMRLAAALRHRVPISELDVYHATPHEFASTPDNPLGEFDASKIGTGEGAQAYGHGIYTAESPKIAQSYYDQFKQKIQGSFDTVIDRRLDAFMQEFGGDVQKAADRFMAGVYDTPKNKAAMRKEVVAQLEARTRQPYMLKADLPDEMIDRMLDWDKPFLEQSQEIKDLAKNLLPAAVYNQLLTQRSGDFVEELAKYKGGKAKASELMRQAGIPGIRYLDAGSRGQGGSGTRNFVVFPGEEKKVRILERK